MNADAHNFYESEAAQAKCRGGIGKARSEAADRHRAIGPTCDGGAHLVAFFMFARVSIQEKPGIFTAPIDDAIYPSYGSYNTIELFKNELSSRIQEVKNLKGI